MTRTRFVPISSDDLMPDEIAFGAAMQAYLARWGSFGGWTCGQVLDVLMDLGLDNPQPNFEICAHSFTTAICAA